MYRLSNDIYINEDILLDPNQGYEGSDNILNFFKEIIHVVKDKEGNLHVYFDDRVNLVYPSWEYCVERFKSFGNIDFK